MTASLIPVVLHIVLKRRLPLSGFTMALAISLASYPMTASAARSQCDFMSGEDRRVCIHEEARIRSEENKRRADQEKAARAAAAAAARGAPYVQVQMNPAPVMMQPVATQPVMTPPAAIQPAQNYSPSPVPAAPAAQSATAAAAPPPSPPSPPPPAPSGTYRLDTSGDLKSWRDVFEKAAHDPAGFADYQSRLTSTINSSGAVIHSTTVGPERNIYEKLQTDYQLYTLYYKAPEMLLSKQMQCLQPRDYSPAEACDCLAGFPGDTSIGPGAGELVVGSNVKTVLKACGAAVDNASDPAQKARYLAQRARAQILTNDQTPAVPWVDKAVADGYRRAVIVMAEANLRAMEFRAGGFPPAPISFYDEQLDAMVEHLQTANSAGVKETGIVVKKYREFQAHANLNIAVNKQVGKALRDMLSD